MSSHEPTQAVPKDARRKGAPDGVNSQGREGATGGSDAGDAYPNPHTGKAERDRADVGGGFMGHGGQSRQGYQGTGRLGEQKTAKTGNPNSASGTK